MFQSELQEKLKEIFGVKKTTFLDPSDSFEQDTLFINVTKCTSNTGQGKAFAKVEGVLTMYSQIEKLRYGYFNKRIQQADHALTKDFFFYEIDVDVPTSHARMQNISERRTNFVYLYRGQYDPNQGELTEVEFEEDIP